MGLQCCTVLTCVAVTCAASRSRVSTSRLITAKSSSLTSSRSFFRIMFLLYSCHERPPLTGIKMAAFNSFTSAHKLAVNSCGDRGQAPYIQKSSRSRPFLLLHVLSCSRARMSLICSRRWALTASLTLASFLQYLYSFSVSASILVNSSFEHLLISPGVMNIIFVCTCSGGATGFNSPAQRPFRRLLRYTRASDHSCARSRPSRSPSGG